MPRLLLRRALLGTVLLAAAPSSAQNLPSWAEPPPPPAAPPSRTVEPPPQDLQGPPDFPPVPIDGGLGLLAAAGAAYAIRRLRRTKTDDGNED